MPQYNPETNQYEETPEERRKREEQSQPGFFDKLGTALQTAGSNFVTNVQNAPENFVNNIKQGFDNVTNAPQNFSNNVSNMVSGPVRPPVATTSPVQTPNIKTTEERIQQQPQFTPDYSLANQQNGPGMRYGQAFAPQEQPVQQQPAQPAMPVQPVQPQQLQPRVMPQQGQPINNQQYNARVESGNNPNIGYHYPADQNGQRKSTAYGTYGITAPAYQDIQRTNPYFANKPITSLTPEEQTQAYQTFTDLNKQQLQRVGVEPTDANLRLAHFLGANGAANYLNNGQISPQAARANGGMEKVQQLAQQKLAGVQAPTSGASLIQQPAQQPVQQQPQPIVEQPTPVQLGINAYQAIQNDPNSLIKLGFNENQPEFIRNRAKERALELYSQDKQLKQAETDLKGMNPNQLATVMQGRDKSSVGDWMQYLLFKHVGLTDLANEKGDQLGIGHKWQGATDGAGNNGLIRYGASGKPLEGVKSDNTPMTSEELAQYASMGTGKWQTNAEYFQDKNGNIYQSQHNDKGQTRIVDTKTSQPYKGAESLQRLRDVSGLDKLNQQQVYRRENFKTQLNNALSKETFANRLGVFKQYNSALVGEGLPPLSMEEMGLTPTGQFNTEIKQPSAGAPTGAPAPAPTGAPAPAAGPRPTLSAIENKKEEEKAAIATQAAANRTRAETAAKTIDEKLNNLNTVQEQAQRGINALENNQHLFGGGSNAIARANNRLNPLKTQSEEYRNTADIMQLAQRENLTNLASLLKGSFSDKDLAYINKNMINENSSPAQVKTWLDHYVAASRRAYEQQASSVNQANAPSPGAPAAPQAQVRKYNPQTGRLE